MSALIRGGESEEYEFTGCESLESRLAEITADEQKATSLNHVTIKLPASLLEKRGFRIIDTPGTNSSDHWHDDVTIRTISELSDLSIIIIDATKALPQQFCEFITANLQSILSQCVFVVTKVDMIRKKELDGIMKYIKEKAQKEFEIKEPLIFPYSSTNVLDCIDELESVGLPELVAESLKSEQQIMDHMSSQKSIVQTLNLIALADNILETIQLHIKTVSEKHECALALVQRKNNLDWEIRKFLDDQNNALYHEIEEIFANWSKKFEQIINDFFMTMRNGISAYLTQINNTDDLTRYFMSQLQPLLNQRTREMLVEINRMDTKVSADSRRICDKFVDNFRENFKDMEIFEEGEELKSLYKPTNDFICLPILQPIMMYAYQFTGMKDLTGNLIPKATKSDSVSQGCKNILYVLSNYI